MSAEAGAARWRPLGEILVERGLINELRLQSALREQERMGGRLGEILFENGWVSAIDLRDALAAQHGLDLRVESRSDGLASGERRSAVPLGLLLVQRGDITESQLDAALALQEETKRRLGELLIDSGAVTTATLADALAEQQGLLAASRDLRATLEGDFVPKPTWYELREANAEPGRGLYASRSFMDATDLAFAILSEWDPGELRVVSVADGSAEELCWQYPPTG
jgi:hypothetical protein